MRTPIPIAATLLIAACSSTPTTPCGDPARAQRTFEMTYEASIPEVPPGAKQVRLWIPLPIDTPDQRITDLRVESSHASAEAPIENGFGRSLCVTSRGEPVRVRASFVVTRFETRGGGSAAKDELAAALEPDRLIPLDGKVAQAAASVPASDDSFEVGRALYRHTLERMRYDKPDGGGWGRGDAEWACDARYGNCTDFHSYFIGLARSKSIPARFEMGFSIPAGDEPVANVSGYHCWAYFWSDAHGWVPVDISEADKAPDKADYYFGTLDENRVTMTGGRDVLLTPRPAAGALNFFVYPYAEIDGVEFKGVQREFSRRIP
jgi:transglutaminase-like putative cysteine protease